MRVVLKRKCIWSSARISEHAQYFFIIKPNRCTNFSNFISEMNLYTFRTVPLSIIRSFSLYTQQWYMSYTSIDSFWAGSGWNAVPSWSCCCSIAVYRPVWHTPLLSVQWITPDDGQRNCSEHVEFHFQNKIWEISASIWFYCKEICHDARSHKCKMHNMSDKIWNKTRLLAPRSFVGWWKLLITEIRNWLC
jgi:hypothetical protein